LASITADTPLRVAHLVDAYLPPSRPWIHRQIVGPPGTLCHVFAERQETPGAREFPCAALTVVGDRRPVFARWLQAIGGDRLGLRPAVGSLRAFAPDVAHAHFGYVGWRWLPVVRRAGVPLVTSFYGHDAGAVPVQDPRFRRRYAELFAKCALVLCEGPALLAVVSALGCPEGKLGLQPLGIETSGIRVEPRRRQPGEPLRVLAAARFTEKKGLPDAVAAVALASREIDIRLTIVGAPAEHAPGREAARQLEAAIASSGIWDRITVVAPLSLPRFLEASYGFHVLLQPSRHAQDGDTEGGAPVTLLDLGATGMPAVATRHADIPYVVRHGHTGLLTEEGDITDLAASLIRLGREPQLLPRLGLEAAHWVRSRHDLSVTSRLLRAHYQAAIRGARTASAMA
jgi:colanic acid/amylovoran biosynthesis glycosyltransferase